MTWETVRLGDVAEYIRGVTYKPADVRDIGDNETVAILRTKNVQSRLELDDLVYVRNDLPHKATQRVRVDDLLVSSSNSWNLVGRAVPATKDSVGMLIGGFIGALRFSSSRIHPRYGYWWFASAETQQRVRSFGRQTTSISNLDVQRTMALQLPLPPLGEQRRIAEILDDAHLQLLYATSESTVHHNLRDALFFHASHGAARRTLSDLGVTLTGGLSVADGGKNPHPVNRILKVNAVSGERFDSRHSKRMPSDYRPPAHHAVCSGQLLMTRASGSIDLIARTAFVDAVATDIYLPDKIWKVGVSNESAIGLDFVAAMSGSREFRQYVRNAASGASGVRNISQAKVLAYEVRVPDESRHGDFVRASAILRETAAASMRRERLAHDLLLSVQRHAFRGEL